MTALKVILIILGAFVLFQAIFRLAKKLHPIPAPALAGRFFDSNFRRWAQPPSQLIERSGIKPGMTVIDLGCGSGAFTTFVARAVGEAGRVYAVDIQPGMLKQLEGKLAKSENQDIINIKLRQASADELPFEDESIDLVYLVGVLQEIPDRGRALREIRRVLRSGGILSVTELLPDPDYPLRATTIKLCQREGFIVDAKFGNLWNYTVRFRKASQSEDK